MSQTRPLSKAPIGTIHPLSFPPPFPDALQHCVTALTGTLSPLQLPAMAEDMATYRQPQPPPSPSGRSRAFATFPLPPEPCPAGAGPQAAGQRGASTRRFMVQQRRGEAQGGRVTLPLHKGPKAEGTRRRADRAAWVIGAS